MDGKDAMPTSAQSDVRLTYDDFLLFPDDGKRHEIIDGVHYVTPSPNRRHQQLSGRIPRVRAIDVDDADPTRVVAADESTVCLSVGAVCLTGWPPARPLRHPRADRCRP